MMLRRLRKSDLVRAFCCSCGFITQPKNAIAHKLECKDQRSNLGREGFIPNPHLFVIQTSRGPVVAEGLDTPEELEKFATTPHGFPLLTEEELKTANIQGF